MDLTLTPFRFTVTRRKSETCHTLSTFEECYADRNRHMRGKDVF